MEKLQYNPTKQKSKTEKWIKIKPPEIKKLA